MKHLNLGFVGFGLIGGSIARLYAKMAQIFLYMFIPDATIRTGTGCKKKVSLTKSGTRLMSVLPAVTLFSCVLRF